MSEHTPLIQQYLDLKARNPDSILFFRVGDFYEMFFEDAEEGSRLLGLALTSRNNGSSDVPLAGVPAKAASEYVARLLRAGRRVAICEQVEDPSEARGLVRREVLEVITPGTVLEETLLTAKRNNYVAALSGNGSLGLAAVDLSTGEFEVRECGSGELRDELARLEPAELLIAADREEVPQGSWTITRREPWRFDPELAAERLQDRFAVRGVGGFGLVPERDGPLIGSAGALVGYLEELRPAGLGHLTPPRVERRGRHLQLDAMTRRNLELVEPLRSRDGATLLEVLDATRTPMGGRLLRRWLLHPLIETDAIVSRQEAVQALFEDRERRRAVRESLGKVRDLERLGGRISTGRAAPRDLLSLVRSLEAVPELMERIGEERAGRFGEIVPGLDPLADVRTTVETAIAPEAPATLREGGVIRPGFSPELDELRALRENAVDWIAGMQLRERERTGIDSLKIGFNKVFGYYIEITKPNLDRVPEEYLRKQTLTNAERYLTPELKEWEEKVVGAEGRIAELEGRLFRELRETVAEEVARIQETARRLAEVDVLAALAHVAEKNGYVRPEVAEDERLEIRAGRHPVVERMMPREQFVPNDILLDEDLRVIVLTGPNMAGKSTVLRQVGLTVLMAQIGSFVPASRARVGLCDKLFTRVGASDDLAAGLSTFMVEMTETATILNGATRCSLVLLDEIGRGTSTYDGVSIAWAVTERLHQLGARTVFATHYHELVELADLLPGVGAFNVAVRESGEEIVFLHRLEPGGCDRSYGVHVARLAGLPPEVVRRARTILQGLENGPGGGGSRAAGVVDLSRGQLSLFAPPEPSLVLERLAGLDPDRLTPLEALNELAALKELATEEGE
ncbi:MAG: DNA mismatch repair protein MutS [Gemmatimonadota bacterium]